MKSHNILDRTHLYLLSMVLAIPFLIAIALLMSRDGILILFGLLVYIGFLFFTHKWPWLLITLILLASTNFLYLLDISFLPAIHLSSGGQFNSLDLMLISLWIIGLAGFVVKKQKPVFAVEVLCILAAGAISCLWGISQHYIDLKIALNGLRYFSPYVLYLALGTMLNMTRDRYRLTAIIIYIAAASLIVQLFEVISKSKFVISTSTPWFYNQTSLLPVGDSSVPYLWNRATSFSLPCLFHLSLRYIMTSQDRKPRVCIPSFRGYCGDAGSFLVDLHDHWDCLFIGDHLC